MPKQPTSEEAIERSYLVRDICAILTTKHISDREKQFRADLLATATDRLGEFTPPQVTRMHEAACDCDFSDDTVIAFRHSLQRSMRARYKLVRSQPAAASKSPAN